MTPAPQMGQCKTKPCSRTHFQKAHRRWVEASLGADTAARDHRWSGAIAVDSQAFVEKVKRELGMRARYREVDETDGTCVLREAPGAYTSDFGPENDTLRPDNTTVLVKSAVSAET